MNYVWEIEYENFKEDTYEKMQEIICSKISNIIIKSEGEDC